MKLKTLLNYYETVEDIYIQKDLKRYLEEDCVISYDKKEGNGLKGIIKLEDNCVYVVCNRVLIRGVRKIRLINIYTCPDFSGELQTYVVSNAYSNVLPMYSKESFSNMIVKDEKIFNKYVKKEFIKNLK